MKRSTTEGKAGCRGWRWTRHLRHPWGWCCLWRGLYFVLYFENPVFGAVLWGVCIWYCIWRGLDIWCSEGCIVWDYKCFLKACRAPPIYRPLGMYQVSKHSTWVYLSVSQPLWQKSQTSNSGRIIPQNAWFNFYWQSCKKLNIPSPTSLFPAGEYFEHTGEQNREPTNSERAQCRILRPFLTQVHNVINHLKCENISVCKGFIINTCEQYVQMFEQTNFGHFSVHQHHNSVEVIGKVQN